MEIKNFYMSKYPLDDLGEEINDNATFIGLLDKIHKGEDIYSYLEVGDSIIRERLFQELSDLLGESYDYVYNLWLDREDNQAVLNAEDPNYPTDDQVKSWNKIQYRKKSDIN